MSSSLSGTGVEGGPLPPPLGEASRVCLFCYKIVVSGGEDDFPRFLMLLGRFIKEEGTLEEFCGGRERVRFSYCRDCRLIVSSFCEAYHQLKCLELRLEWKLGTMVNIMRFANRVPSRMEGLKRLILEETGDSGAGEELRDRKMKNSKALRTKLIRKCVRKLSTSQPRVRLERKMGDGHQNAPPASVLVPSNTPTVALLADKIKAQVPNTFSVGTFLGWSLSLAAVTMLASMSTQPEVVTTSFRSTDNQKSSSLLIPKKTPPPIGELDEDSDRSHTPAFNAEDARDSDSSQEEETPDIAPISRDHVEELGVIEETKPLQNQSLSHSDVGLGSPEEPTQTVPTDDGVQIKWENEDPLNSTSAEEEGPTPNDSSTTGGTKDKTALETPSPHETQPNKPGTSEISETRGNNFREERKLSFVEIEEESDPQDGDDYQMSDVSSSSSSYTDDSSGSEDVGPKFHCKSSNKPFRTRRGSEGSREKCFSCSVCQARFTSSEYVKKHFQRLHKQDGPDHSDTFHCDLCPAYFVKRRQLQTHKLVVHFKNKCPECGDSFKRHENLKSHLEKTHPEICLFSTATFICNIGPFRKHFMNELALEKHQKTCKLSRSQPCVRLERIVTESCLNVLSTPVLVPTTTPIVASTSTRGAAVVPVPDRALVPDVPSPTSSNLQLPSQPGNELLLHDDLDEDDRPPSPDTHENCDAINEDNPDTAAVPSSRKNMEELGVILGTRHPQTTPNYSSTIGGTNEAKSLLKNTQQIKVNGEMLQNDKRASSPQNSAFSEEAPISSDRISKTSVAPAGPNVEATELPQNRVYNFRERRKRSFVEMEEDTDLHDGDGCPASPNSDYTSSSSSSSSSSDDDEEDASELPMERGRLVVPATGTDRRTVNDTVPALGRLPGASGISECWGYSFQEKIKRLFVEVETEPKRKKTTLESTTPHETQPAKGTRDAVPFLGRIPGTSGISECWGYNFQEKIKCLFLEVEADPLRRKATLESPSSHKTQPEKGTLNIPDPVPEPQPRSSEISTSRGYNFREKRKRSFAEMEEETDPQDGDDYQVSDVSSSSSSDDDHSSETEEAEPTDCKPSNMPCKTKGNFVSVQKLDGTFKCQFCEMVKDFAPDLALHESEEHAVREEKTREMEKGGRKILPCARCPFDSFDLNSFFNHFLSAHFNETSTEYNSCVVCQAKFTHPSDLMRHFERLHKTDGLNESEIFRCDLCTVYFVKRMQLQTHKLVVHFKKKCPECGDSFKRHGYLRIHLGKLHPEVDLFSESRLICDIGACRKKCLSDRALERHKRTCKGHKYVPEIFKCDICNKEFTDKKKFTDHKHSHPSKVPSICPECGKVFDTKRKFNGHMHSHRHVHKEATVMCSECGKAFKSKAHLKTHMLYHRGPEAWKFQCSTCGRKLATKQKLDQHQRTHTKEKPFICRYCGEKYAQRHNWKNHVKTKHPEEYQQEEGESWSKSASSRKLCAGMLSRKGSKKGECILAGVKQ